MMQYDSNKLYKFPFLFQCSLFLKIQHLLIDISQLITEEQML